jgi:peptidoglycan glycosyltransferase
VRLFGVVVLLFALLVFFTSRWTVFEASSLNDNPLNVRTLLDELQIKRGQILANDNTVLAQSVPAPQHTWTRFYPTRDLFSQAVGYSIAAQGRQAGLEQSWATTSTRRSTRRPRRWRYRSWPAGRGRWWRSIRGPARC